MTIKETLTRLIRGEDLATDEAHALMAAIMSGELSAAQIAAVLTALRMKGESVAEIAGFASAMRQSAIQVPLVSNDTVDTCGTGGDGTQTFNISTACALVAAAMGIPVAKHGNRAVSSHCGSADVLEALGVVIDLPPAAVARLIDHVGVGFLFAPRYHPAMKHAAPVRQQLGVRTVFNLLGPLTNPAGVRRQLLGVFREDLTELLCGVLRELGTEKAFVVHGRDGMDEVSLTAETTISELNDGEIHTYSFTPEEAGLARTDLVALAGGDARENATCIEEILDGAEGPRTDAVLLNVAFVAVLAGRATDPAEGVRQARKTVASGRARRLLSALCAESQRLAGKAP